MDTQMNNHPPQKIIEVVNSGFQINNFIWGNVDGLDIPKSKKNMFATACYDQVIEHQLATCCLVRSRIYGTAFALARLIFDGFVRGVWLENCATEEDVLKYEKDTLDLKFYEYLEAIEALPGFESGVLGKLKKTSWKAMNSFAHSGIHQVSRRLSKNYIEPIYDENEVVEVVKLASSFGLLSFQRIGSIAGRLDLSEKASEMIGAF